MSTTTKTSQAARAFAREWSGKGYEKGETQRFWIELFQVLDTLPEDRDATESDIVAASSKCTRNLLPKREPLVQSSFLSIAIS